MAKTRSARCTCRTARAMPGAHISNGTVAENYVFRSLLLVVQYSPPALVKRPGRRLSCRASASISANSGSLILPVGGIDASFLPAPSALSRPSLLSKEFDSLPVFVTASPTIAALIRVVSDDATASDENIVVGVIFPEPSPPPSQCRCEHN